MYDLKNGLIKTSHKTREIKPVVIEKNVLYLTWGYSSCHAIILLTQKKSLPFYIHVTPNMMNCLFCLLYTTQQHIVHKYRHAMNAAARNIL